MTAQPTSDGRFEIGDAVMLINATWNHHMNGSCGTVTDDLRVRTYVTPVGEFTKPCYEVELLSGERVLARPHQLKKIEPPRNDRQLVCWSECPWQPEVLRV
jgi:hypothetical protein